MDRELETFVDAALKEQKYRDGIFTSFTQRLIRSMFGCRMMRNPQAVHAGHRCQVGDDKAES